MSGELQTVNQTQISTEQYEVNKFELAQRQARLMAASTIVPARFQGNASNCFIAMELAQRMNLSPLAVMEGLWISPNNTPAWYSKFLIAALNSTGRFSTLEYHEVGQRNTPGWGFYCTVTELATGKELKGSTITLEIARKDGWVDRKGSKWQTMPELMLRYRAAAFLVRQYVPEVSMGLMTREEIEDIESERGTASRSTNLKERLRQKADDVVDAEFTTEGTDGSAQSN